jgi:hypothetical protein
MIAQASFNTMRYKGRDSASGIDRKLSIMIFPMEPPQLGKADGKWCEHQCRRHGGLRLFIFFARANVRALMG